VKISQDNYRKNNSDKEKERHIKYLSENKDKRKETTKKYREGNPEKIKESAKKYKNKRNEHNKDRCVYDSLFKLTCNIRSLIRSSIKRCGYTKKSKTHEILGCSYEEFLNYIESKWSLQQNLDENGQVWMTWDNYGKYNGTFNYGWDFDHITPISLDKTYEGIIKFNNYINFQPLCSKNNRDIKRNNLI
jgi:hypothetical protein